MSLPSVTPCAQIQTQVLPYVFLQRRSSRANFNIDSSASDHHDLRQRHPSLISLPLDFSGRPSVVRGLPVVVCDSGAFSKLPIRCLSSSTRNMPVLLPCSRRSLGGE